MNTLLLPNTNDPNYQYCKKQIEEVDKSEKTEIKLVDSSGSYIAIVMTAENTQDGEDVHSLLSMLYFMLQQMEQKEFDVVSVCCLAFGVYAVNGDNPNKSVNVEEAKKIEDIRMKERAERLKNLGDNEKAQPDVNVEEEGEDSKVKLEKVNSSGRAKKGKSKVRNLIKILKGGLVIICGFILIEIFV